MKTVFKKNILKRAPGVFLVSLLIAGWIFSGWPGIFNFPPKPPEANATTIGPYTASSNAAVASSAGDNDGFETTPTNTTSDDAAYAVSTNTGTGTSGSCALPNTVSDQHDFYDFSIASIPTGAVIDGILVDMDAKYDGNTGTNTYCAFLSYNAGTNWTAGKNSADIGTSDTSFTLGGSTDTWGRTWSASEFTNANFRLRVMTLVGSSNQRDASLDYLAVTVYYTLPPTVSGTLYSNEGSTQITSGKTIRLSVNGGATLSTTTDSGSGTWHIDLASAPAVGNPIAVFVDGDSGTRAFTLTKASSTVNNITGVDLYQNRVIAKHEGTSGTSTTNTDFATYDADNDADIMFTANSGALSVQKGQELHVWTGKTFAPGGAVTLHGNAAASPDGDLHIDDNAVLTAGGDITLAGNWAADTGSTFTASSKTVIFNATTTGKTIAGTLTGNSSFATTTFNGSGGAWSFSNNASTTNKFTITNGTVTAPSGFLTIRGDYSNSGIFTHNSGTTTFDGTATQTLSGTMTGASAWNHLEFRGATANFSANASSTNFFIAAPSGGGGEQKKTFCASGCDYGTGTTTWTVPANVTSIVVKAWGAGGGGGGGGITVGGGAGGGGGAASSTISVTAGEDLDVHVGSGSNGGLASPTSGGCCAGTNGGGGGGDDGDGNGGGGGGGGAYSAVKRGSTFLIQAGAGGAGGGGCETPCTSAGGAGGAGGGTSGVAGAASSGGGAGGNPGTDTAGGSGGSAGGGDGTANQGGVGENGATSGGTGGGGGGGGGRFGGEGGAGNVADRGGGGGGGGSSLADNTLSGSGTTAGGSTDADYAGSVGAGGSAGGVGANGGNGTAGRVVIIYTPAASSPSVTAPSGLLSISGHYTNNSAFTHNSGTTTMRGASQQTMSGTMTGASAFSNLEITNNSGSDAQTDPSVIFGAAASTTGALTAITANTKLRFPANATSTFTNLRLNGQAAGTKVTLRSGTSGTAWKLHSSGWESISYTDVKDSNACSGNPDIDASDGTNTDSTGNTCWNFAPATPAFTQSAYRFFDNNDGAQVGNNPLAALNATTTLASSSQQFRLRALIHVSNATLSSSGENFKLQYVDKGAGSWCGAPSGGTPSGWTDVTASTLLAYYNNASPADGAAMTASTTDPTHSGDTVVAQTYEEANNFTNSQAAIPAGQDGKWDFSLYDNNAPGNTTYCLRIVKSDGTALGTYSEYPAVTTGTITLDQLHYRWRNPNGNESSAAFDAAEDTALTNVFHGDSKRLRFLLKNSGTGTALNHTFRLEVASSTDSYTFWTTVPSLGAQTTEHWRMNPTTGYADGDATTDNSGLTNPSGTFVAGKALSYVNQTTAMTLLNSRFTELEYSVISTSYALQDITYRFRLTNAGSTSNFVYTVNPQVTISSQSRPQFGGGGVEGSGSGAQQSGGGQGGGSGSGGEGSGSGGQQGGGGSGGGGGLE